MNPQHFPPAAPGHQQSSGIPSSNVSQGSAGSRRSNSSKSKSGPTISIENVELLEADRHYDEKRSRRGSRQQEAEAAAAAAAAVFMGDGGTRGGGGAQLPVSSYQSGPVPPSGYGFDPYTAQQYQQQQQIQHDPAAASNYFAPKYVPAPAPPPGQHSHGLAPRQQPHYGMSYQGGYQATGSGFYSPPAQQGAYPGSFGFSQQQQQQPHHGSSSKSGSATEYTGMLASSSGGVVAVASSSGFGGYGSLGGSSGHQAAQPTLPPANLTDVTGSSNRGMGALTIDDIEKTFDAVLAMSCNPCPDPATAAPSSSNAAPHSNHSFSKISPVANTSDLSSGISSKPKGPSLPKEEKVWNSGISGGPPLSGGIPPTHRRSGSSASMGSRGRHRRVGSTGNLPPVGPRSSPSPSLGNRKKPDEPRRRSMSGTFALSGNGSVGGGRPRRPSLSRNNSSTDMQSVGGVSVTSHHSIVSDISKSALFQGVTEQGHVQLHFPYEAVRLVNHPDMEAGRLYMQEIPPSEYENYHLAAEEITGWEHHMDHENRFKSSECNCTCNNCNGCTGKKELLPRAYYAFKVEDDLYRRLLDEVSGSSMPCGLFFCGHHEDVSFPSIKIAYFMVALLFLSMAYVAFIFKA